MKYLLSASITAFTFSFCSIINPAIAEQDIVTHTIQLTIDPEASFLEAETTFSYNKPFKQKKLTLLQSLKLYEMKHSSGDYEYVIERLGEHHTTILIHNKSVNEEELPQFTFKYKGQVYEEPSETNLTQRHSRTLGIISNKENEGIYLPASAFYPVSDDEMAMFDVSIQIPAAYTIIASGTKSKMLIEDHNLFRYTTEFPIQHMTLVGGRFVKESKTFDNVEFALYTYAKSPHSEQYLSTSIEYYKRYTELFGEYPFDAFRIVENFFNTGLGMPGYTLLSGRLLQMPWVTLSPGSLAHEFVHNWWGNSVFVDYDKGNWCEALTTFSTNYYYNVLTENHNGAMDWRKKALISISDLPADKQYPVSQFISQRDIFDAVIGYQKGAFAINEIYKFMGKDAFFSTLKDFALKYKGQKAYWEDLIEAFAQHSANTKYNVPINKLANQLLNSTSIPDLFLGDVRFDKSSMQVELQIMQENDLYVLVPIEYSNSEQTAVTEQLINTTDNLITFKTEFVPDKIRLDPTYETLRELNLWEKPYNMYRTLNAAPIIIMPDQNSADYEMALELQNMLLESGYNFEAIQFTEVTENILHNHSLIVLGNTQSNGLFSRIASLAPESLKFDTTSIHYEEKKYQASRHLLMFSSDHPTNRHKFCTSIYFKDLTDLSQFRRLFHYQRVSLVLLSQEQAGRPAAQAEIMPSDIDTSRLWRKL